MSITSTTAVELAAGIASGQYSAREVTTAFLDRIEQTDDRLNAFLAVDRAGALAAADEVDRARAAGEALGPLAGVPVGVKDVITTAGLATTCGSRMLEGWIPPYDATVTANLRRAGAIIIGKTNMDEFAMGSSTENSAFGPSRNPWNTDLIPGGSSGGSAVAVAARQVPLSIGTDTGGSIRQPAAMTGVVGVKPTYGAVSRYGLVAMASSLDQAGPFATTVADAALLHSVIAGHDPRDSTSLEAPVPPVVAAATAGDVTGMRIGVVKELTGEGFQPEVREHFRRSLDLLSDAGAQIVEVSCPHFEYALAAYYLIMPSECSSNLAKFDAVRYGLRVGDDGQNSVEQVMALSREAGFGPEVKRRIMLGTYALSSGYYDAYYGQAQKVRTLIARDFAQAFEVADVLATPTAPTTAFPIGEKVDDPLSMYLQDIATIPANLAGVPGMSLPVGLDGEGLPVGLQFMAPAMADHRMYKAGAALEAAVGWEARP
ncbi:MAG TPA: Asp-tRNA(Asn)/Glu-tRNA(Gln) amidotransferase subunit GatA [Actinomycetota bacterium]|nr:Asp-tRNA(Asn)/Glu-tRNA(Gln) amidotransferase subunit GatA [Actinomycetota bacterium]